MITWTYKGNIPVSDVDLSVLSDKACEHCEGKGYVERDKRWFACWCVRRGRFNACYAMYIELGMMNPYLTELGAIQDIRADFCNIMKRALMPDIAREFMYLLRRQARHLTTPKEDANIKAMKAIVGGALAEANWAKEYLCKQSS